MDNAILVIESYEHEVFWNHVMGNAKLPMIIFNSGNEYLNGFSSALDTLVALSRLSNGF